MTDHKEMIAASVTIFDENNQINDMEMQNCGKKI